ncbi:MAG TPA: M56 family metallopeptidase [Candidatus Eisenbacteria bacterium]|nr:M56 family metallopeptidase [Candidatus Eisenbacteria bacterium]
MTSSAGVLLSVLAAAGFGDLLSLFIRVTLIAAVGILVCSVLRNASAAKRYLAAMATLIALTALPIARAFLPVVPLPILPATMRSAPLRADAPPAIQVEGRSGVALPRPSGVPDVETAGATAPERSGGRFSDYVILVSFLVSSALLLHVLISFTAAAFAARRARRIDDAELRGELELACRRLGVSRPVDLRECSHITVPSVWGLVRPVLLLPGAARAWSRERIRVVFLHEVAHVARHDGIGLLVARIATAVFWFHPLVWLLARVARRECERSCDDLVLGAGERATDYAAHLLAMVRSMTRRDRFLDLAPAMARGSNLESRLVSILRPGQRRDAVSRLGLFATVGVAGFLLAATTVVQVVAAPEPVDEYGELVRRANRDAREQAREVEAAVMAALEAGEDAKESAPSEESPCAEPASPAVLSIIPEPEVLKVSVAPSPVYAVAGSQNRHRSRNLHESKNLNESGIELLREGRYSRAISAFEEEIRQTGSPNAMYNLACAHALQGDKKRAFDTLKKAIENGFDNTHHMTEDEDLRSLQGDPHFYELVRLAGDLQLFGSGRFGDMDDEEDWRRALPRLERVTREHPTVGRAWSNLAFARLAAGDPKGGVAAYQKALDLGYQKPTTLYNLACCAARSGDIDGAFQWLDRADQAGFEIGAYAGSDTDLDALRGDPRYGAMLKRWDEKMAKKHREKHSAEVKQRAD